MKSHPNNRTEDGSVEKNNNSEKDVYRLITYSKNTAWKGGQEKRGYSKPGTQLNHNDICVLVKKKSLQNVQQKCSAYTTFAGEGERCGP